MLHDSILQNEQQMSCEPMEAARAKLSVSRGRHGDIVYFSNDRPIGQSIARYGDWARIETRFLCGLIGLGGTVLDIGANIGTHSIEFSKRVGLKGVVHAFEPQAEVFALLKRNLQSAGCSNVVAASLAVAEQAGEMVVPDVDYDSHANVGAVALLPGDATNVGSPRRVRAIAVDDLQLERCDLVKIDVEGMACLVLKGMNDTITRLQPAIFCECNTIETGLDLVRLIPEGYQAFLVRCPVFDVDNARSSSDNMFGYACEAGLLLMPSQDAHAVKTIASCMAEVIAFQTFDELARAILATPRCGDASKFERDPERLKMENRDLKSLLAERDARLLDLKQENALAVKQAKELDDRHQIVEQATLSSDKTAKSLLAERDLHTDEITRLHFRAASLSKRLNATEEKLSRANEARSAAAQEMARAHDDLKIASDKIDSLSGQMAAGRDQLAETIARGLWYARQLAAAYDELDDLVPRRLLYLLWTGRLSRRLDPLRRYHQCVTDSGLFDRQWYMDINHDVTQSGIDPLWHYLRRGAAQLRDPSPHFSTAQYLAAHLDVAKAGINPLVHYVLHGRQEGRRVDPSRMGRS